MAARTLGPFLIVASLATLAAAAAANHTTYFDIEKCIDPAGMRSCEAKLSAQMDKCVGSCQQGDSDHFDCFGDCDIVRIQDEISCAAAHCWNQVYSCEYQITVGQLFPWILVDPFEGVPFFPPPDNAPSACNCNLANARLSISETRTEYDTCGKKGDELRESQKSAKDQDAFVEACDCCAVSAYLSALPAACPNHNMTALGLESLRRTLLLGEEREEFWQSCAAPMDRFPCGSDGMDWTPPRDEDGANGKFLKPAEFAAFTGTQVLANGPGTVTAPVSGPTFTWTHNGRTMAVTVANPDAKPTGEPGDVEGEDKKGEDEEVKDEGEGGDGGSAALRNEAALPLLGLLMAWAFM